VVVPREAVMMADPAEVIVPALAVKGALVELAGTTTEAGTVRVELLEERVTVSLPVKSAFVSVTVQEVLPLDPMLLGVHCTEDRVTGACKVMVEVAEAPLRVAVMVALPLEMRVPVLAAKLAVAELANTVTEAGTVRPALSEDSDTVVPPVGAAFDNVTVQVLVALDARVVGEH
jgi:hypothetical protein